MNNFHIFFNGKCWWGKILGAFFGFLMGGAAGALLGLLIGNFFDKALNQQFNRPFSTFYDEKNRELQNLFIEATFTTLGYIAKSDGRVSEHEIQAARTLMDSIRLTKKQRESAQTYFNQGKSNPSQVESLLNLFKMHCRNNAALLHTFANIQYAMAQVDGLNEKNITALNKIFLKLGLSPLNKQHRFYEDFNYSSQRQQRQQWGYSDYSDRTSQNPFENSANTLQQAYSILGVKVSDNEATIKKAYRRLISQHHPDRLIAKGASEAEIKVANNKTQTIRKAYEQICASKGW